MHKHFKWQWFTQAIYLHIMLNISKHYLARNGDLLPIVCVACWNFAPHCMKLLGNLKIWLTVLDISVRGGGEGSPLAWKISGQTLLSGQAQVARKSWMINDITVNPGHSLFFKANASCSKFLNDKKYFNTVKNSRVNSVFGASASCSKTWMIKNIYSVQWIQGTSVFQGKRKLLKNPERWKKFQFSIFSVYSLGYDLCYLD